jgi:O-antigen biosynthesis protein
MPRVCVGIHVHAEPERLAATLASVRAHTTPDAELVFLPDGPDAATSIYLAELQDVPQLGTELPLGPAACFNRLASRDADVLVLLESGSQVGPYWLDHLVKALADDPRNGLAGPSTNRSWNEQGIFPAAGNTPEEIACAAAEAARRFGDGVRTLDPLYSLADFCYAVRREVVATIGAADEQYGLGPCWEMDYNIRAARAGFRGVWACAAYVHRAPFSTRRRWEEEIRFDASRRHYQDKFCGRRLRGENSTYRSHCRGDACPNFAPAPLIQLTMPLSLIESNRPNQCVAVDLLPKLAEPLVSCIMPTCDRRAFVPLAVRWFQRQDYSNLELIVVDDGGDAIADCLPCDHRIRYVRLQDRRTIGAKRNLACAHARGAFIVHWDDDDWYPTWRVRRQVRVLTDSGADLCGSGQAYYYDPTTSSGWRYHYQGAVPWVMGNTLAYRKSYWQEHPFPDIQIGEDSRFIWSGSPRKLHDLADPALCVGIIHATNTSRKVTEGCYWHSQPASLIYDLLGPDAAAFRFTLLGPSTEPEANGSDTSLPLVSCIMPTYNRREFIPLALESFGKQSYQNKELIVIDDGTDAVADLVAGLPGVRYFQLRTKLSIGAKRNIACQHALGTIIAHWDDDDWYSPLRLLRQVAPILSGDADMTGLENAFVLVLPDGQFWTTRRDLHRLMFVGDVHGGTLVYRKTIWDNAQRYPDVNLAEDAAFIQQAQRRGRRLLRLENLGHFVYVRHDRNAWKFSVGNFLDPAGWQRVEAPETFLPHELSAYKSAANKRLARAGVLS